MRIEGVVVNASPLITLFRSEQADLLPRLFSRISIPEAVWQEVVVAGRDDAAARELGAQSWPIRQAVVPSPRVEIWNLGAGQTAVLSYALANSGVRAVVDDADARRCARTLGSPCSVLAAFCCSPNGAASCLRSPRDSPNGAARDPGCPTIWSGC
jgi:predicted nucleic acid-binding protein